MAGKRTKIRKKIKLNKKLVCTIGVLLLIIAVISAIIMIFKPINVGKINKEGKAEYIERVANVTKYPDKKIVEFKNNYELIDNGIITTEIYEKFKKNVKKKTKITHFIKEKPKGKNGNNKKKKNTNIH